MAANSLLYQGKIIHERDEMLSLTDMWRAAGGNDSKRPADWLNQSATKEFVSYMESTASDNGSELIQALNENGTWNTWAHWQIAMAYAKYLSPEFHKWCNDVVKSHMEGRNVPIQATSAVIAISETAYMKSMSILTGGLQAILEGQQKTAVRVESLECDVGYLKNAVNGLRGEICTLSQKRRRIKDSVKSEIANAIMKMGGKCPCCGITTVIDQNGINRFTEWDHFYQNSLATAEHVWLICKPCHAELTRGQVQRGQRQIEFNAFQAKRLRLPGAQNFLEI